MTTDRGPHGNEIFTFRPTGWGRYIDVAFLAVWLTGWLVGEVVVSVILGGMLAGMIASVFGITLSFASRMTPDGSTPFFVLFMLFWLTMWTIGGLAAGMHFLRTLAGRDIVSVSPNGLEIEWRAGPFRRRRTIARGDIHRVRLGVNRIYVIADTARGSVNLATFGTPDECEALVHWLNRHLGMPGEAEAKRLIAETAPPDWEVEVDGMETRLCRIKRRDRRIVAAILWGLAAVMFTGFLPVLVSPASNVEWTFNAELIETPANRVTGAHIAAGVLSLLIAMWAAWTTWGRSEWAITPGRMTWRRRIGSWQRERSFENATLELEHTVDSDGDDRFTLRVRGDSGRRKISSSLNDATDLSNLGEWISARSRFPFDRPSV
jgi:hypothetical protein